MTNAPRRNEVRGWYATARLTILVAAALSALAVVFAESIVSAAALGFAGPCLIFGGMVLAQDRGGAGRQFVDEYEQRIWRRVYPSATHRTHRPALWRFIGTGFVVLGLASLVGAVLTIITFLGD